MAATVFVFVAHEGGQMDNSARELAAAARSFFPGTSPVALVAGFGVDSVCDQATACFGEVWKFDQKALGYPNAELLRTLLVKILPAGATVLLPHTTLGMDLGPGLSVKLGSIYVPDVVGTDGLQSTTLKVVRQEYSGQVSVHLDCDVSKGAVITVRSGAFRADKSEPPAGRIVKIVDRSADAVGITARRRFVEVIPAETGDVDITREDVLVSVGRGIGEKENISIVEELAEAMGAAMSCSRPVVDAKWLEKSRQVGTSGKTVNPKIYLALGISGSFQHLGGLKGNPFIVAVNKNPKAPIFQVASVGVVADLLELLPALTQKIKENH
jgi:electron transfer flavoprotein alpha subunit